jgi:D-alanine-D-alanine ligase
MSSSARPFAGARRTTEERKKSTHETAHRERQPPMKILIVHNAVSSSDSAEDLDTLTQVQAISDALCRLGHDGVTLPCTLDLAALQKKLLDCRPQLVFNLVESLGGTDSLMFLAAALLDALGLPYTGSSGAALFTTNHKLVAKRLMQSAGLPTPHWLSTCGWDSASTAAPLEPPCIVKSIWEHSSRGLDDENVIGTGDSALVRRRVQEFSERTGRPYFAEAFIDGREFNVSMLDGADGPCLLPVAEMDFSAFPGGKPRIIGHRAKWHEASFEYNNTPRSFIHHQHDSPLVEHLSRLALECWRLFGLRGYARIDFRVDSAGRPWILEINTNPCLSPDAGYAAALEEAGLEYDESIRRIVASSRPGLPA